MAEKKTRERAQAAKKRGNSPSTQAGAYVHEEIEHIREGKHGAKNAKQAIAIGLSKARRDGVKLPAQKSSAAKTAKKETAANKARGPVSRKRSAAAKRALKKLPREAASHTALSRHAKKSARDRKQVA